MNPEQTSQSSFGSIVFTTNIPGSKEQTLNPKNISYSDNPDLKLTNTTSKIYFYSFKIINSEYLAGQSRSNLLNILFNKNRFEKIPDEHFEDTELLDTAQTRDQIVTSNITTYIERIFTTFPKSYNIKRNTAKDNRGGLNFTLPFVDIPYTYLNVDGAAHTVSRVVYYDDNKDITARNILKDYDEFLKWYTEKNRSHVFIDQLIKDFEKLFDTESSKALSENIVKMDANNNKRTSFETAIKTSYDELLGYKNTLVEIADEAETIDKAQIIDKAYTVSRTFSDQIKETKKKALSRQLIPSHKANDILKLLTLFQTHYEIYANLKNQMYNTDMLKSKYDRYSRYNEYIRFLRKIKSVYEYKDDFELSNLEEMIGSGVLKKQGNNSGFDNESIRLHIDLIKGKVNNENITQIECEYKDNDLVDRWNKLDLIIDSDDIEYLPYHTINDKKQIKKGGKLTRRRRHKKRILTRKR